VIILVFILPCKQCSIWFSFKIFFLCPISYRCDQFNYSPIGIQRCTLCILKKYSWLYYNLQIWWFILHMYSNFIISINALNIIVTLYIYIKYIKLLHKIFVKHIVPSLQIHPNYFIIILKIITKDIYNYMYYIIVHIILNYIY